MVVAQSLCMLSVRQTGNLVLCSCGPDSSATSSLRTLWKLNRTRISFSSNNDHYFSEQTVKGASERLEGWVELGEAASIWGYHTHLPWGGSAPQVGGVPASTHVNLSLARAGLCIKRVVATTQLRPQVAASQ